MKTGYVIVDLKGLTIDAGSQITDKDIPQLRDAYFCGKPVIFQNFYAKVYNTTFYYASLYCDRTTEGYNTVYPPQINKTVRLKIGDLNVFMIYNEYNDTVEIGNQI